MKKKIIIGVVCFFVAIVVAKVLVSNYAKVVENNRKEVAVSANTPCPTPESKELVQATPVPAVIELEQKNEMIKSHVSFNLPKDYYVEYPSYEPGAESSEEVIINRHNNDQKTCSPGISLSTVDTIELQKKMTRLLKQVTVKKYDGYQVMKRKTEVKVLNKNKKQPDKISINYLFYKWDDKKNEVIGDFAFRVWVFCETKQVNQMDQLVDGIKLK